MTVYKIHRPNYNICNTVHENVTGVVANVASASPKTLRACETQKTECQHHLQDLDAPLQFETVVCEQSRSSYDYDSNCFQHNLQRRKLPLTKAGGNFLRVQTL